MTNKNEDSDNPLDKFLSKRDQGLLINNGHMIERILYYSISVQATMGKVLEELVDINQYLKDGENDQEQLNEKLIKIRQDIFEFTETRHADIIADLANQSDNSFDKD